MYTNRLISEIQNLARKIARNKSKGYSTETLENDLKRKRAQAVAKGITLEG